MASIATLKRVLASRLSGIEGGELQISAGLQVRVAELLLERRRLRKALRDLLDDKKTTYGVRANRARQLLDS